MVEQGQQETELGRQRERPVKIRRDGVAFARDSRNCGQQIATECPDLKPSGPGILPATNCQDQCPSQRHDHDQQEEGKERPPDLGVEHGRRL